MGPVIPSLHRNRDYIIGGQSGLSGTSHRDTIRKRQAGTPLLTEGHAPFGRID